MYILETEPFYLGKMRTFIDAFQHLGDDLPMNIKIDDTNGNITIQISCGNDNSCLALKRKKV